MSEADRYHPRHHRAEVIDLGARRAQHEHHREIVARATTDLGYSDLVPEVPVRKAGDIHWNTTRGSSWTPSIETIIARRSAAADDEAFTRALLDHPAGKKL